MKLNIDGDESILPSLSPDSFLNDLWAIICTFTDGSVLYLVHNHSLVHSCW